MIDLTRRRFLSGLRSWVLSTVAATGFSAIAGREETATGQRVFRVVAGQRVSNRLFVDDLVIVESGGRVTHSVFLRDSTVIVERPAADRPAITNSTFIGTGATVCA